MNGRVDGHAVDCACQPCSVWFAGGLLAAGAAERDRLLRAGRVEEAAHLAGARTPVEVERFRQRCVDLGLLAPDVPVTEPSALPAARMAGAA